MALVTVQRSPSPSASAETEETDGQGTEESVMTKSPRQKSFRESYFTVKGAALILPQSDLEPYTRKATKSHGDDIQGHLKAMFSLLRPQDTIKVAVKLEGSHTRYMVVVSCIGRQDTEESIILGVSLVEEPCVALIMPVWAHTDIGLDGDGGFSISSDNHSQIFKPVSVQAMWSVLQSLNKVQKIANDNLYIPKGLTHTWVGYYESKLSKASRIVSEWRSSKEFLNDCRPDKNIDFGPDSIYTSIKTELKNVMMSVDLEEVTCRFVRQSVEKVLGIDLKEYKSFIDTQMFEIMGQMEEPTKITDFLYLGSEWNASNLEELQRNGVNYILNISREIDNFYPGILHYMNIFEWDLPETDLMKYWKDTHKFISKSRKRGSKTLVHCRMGISRSASTVMAFLMKENNWSRQEAFDFVKAKRSIVNPNQGFWKQLEFYEGVLQASNHRRKFSLAAREKRSLTLPEEDQLADPAFELTAEEILAIKTGSRHMEGDILHTEQDLEVGSRSDSAEEAQPDQRSPIVAGEAGPTMSSADSEAFTFPSQSSFTTDSSESTDSEGSSGEEEGASDNDDNTVFTPIEKQAPSISVPADQPKPRKVEGKRSKSKSESDKNLLSVDDKVSRCSRESSVSKYKDDGSWIKIHDSTDSEAEEERLKDLKDIAELDPTEGIVIDFKSKNETDSKPVMEEVKGTPDVRKESETSVKETPPVPSESVEDSQEGLKTQEEAPAADTSADTSAAQKRSVCVEHGVQKHYTTENIPWSPGTVKKQKQDLEDRLKSEPGHKKSDSQTSTDLQALIDADSHRTATPVQEPLKEGEVTLDTPTVAPEADNKTEPVSEAEKGSPEGSGVEETSGSPLGMPFRKSSVYDLEDIPLPPGTVKRTTQQIEERNSLPPRRVQRSSSLKNIRTTPKARDRDNERRKTCIALLSPTASEGNMEDTEKTEKARLSTGMSMPIFPQAASTEQVDETGMVKVYKFLGEEVTVQEGHVRRQTLDIEHKAYEVKVTKPVKLDFGGEEESRTSDPSSPIAFYIDGPDSSTPGPSSQSEHPVDTATDLGTASSVKPDHSVGKSATTTQAETMADGQSDISVEKVVPAGHDRSSQDTRKTGSEQQSHSVAMETPPKARSFKKQESCFDKETLELIREIGSALLNSPAKVALEEESDAPLEGGSLVSHYVRNIERRVMKDTKKKQTREIVIVDSDTQERKQQRFGQTTSASKLPTCDIGSLSKEGNSPTSKPIEQRSSDEVPKASLPVQTGDNVRPKSPQKAGDPSSPQKAADSSLLTLNLHSTDAKVEGKAITTPDACSQLDDDAEACSVKKILQKFENPESKSAASTPVSGNILSPCSAFSSFPGDQKVIEVVDLAPSGDSVGKVDNTSTMSPGKASEGSCGKDRKGAPRRLLKRQSEPVFSIAQSDSGEPVVQLSEQSVALLETKLKALGDSGDKLLSEESSSSKTDKSKVLLRQKSETATATRPKSAEHKHTDQNTSSYPFGARRRSNLRQSRTLPDSETNQPPPWEGKKVRKLYGTSHPLANLEDNVKRKNPFYNTM